MGLQQTHKKILITGANGQLGTALNEEHTQYDFDCVFATKKVLDITSKISIESAIKAYQPDVIVNTAAYTAVDVAESHEEEAYLLNEIAVKNLADLCTSHGISLIHISTDYVFDGTSETPYAEVSQTNPQTVYGKSKLAGEHAIQSVKGLTYMIIRTSWLFSAYGDNFYKTMLRLGKEKAELSVVNDQQGIPTLANDLANAIFKIIPSLETSNSGVYHYSNKGITTWYAFAKAIFKHANLDVNVLPVGSSSYPTAAKRPKNSILDCTKITRTFNVNRSFWKEVLEQII